MTEWRRVLFFSQSLNPHMLWEGSLTLFMSSGGERSCLGLAERGLYLTKNPHFSGFPRYKGERHRPGGLDHFALDDFYPALRETLLTCHL